MRNRLICLWLFLCALSGPVVGHPVIVSAFGHGATRAEAIESARRNAVEDALSAVTGRQGSTMFLVGNVNRFVQWSKIIHVAESSSGQYEAFVEAEIEVAHGSVMSSKRLRVAIVADPASPADSITSEMIDSTRTSLLVSPWIQWVSASNPTVLDAVARISSGRPLPVSTGSVRGDVDVLCMIASELIPRSKDASSAAEGLDLKVRWTAYDLRLGQVKQVKRLKTSVAGAVPGSQSQLAGRASEEIVRATNDLALSSEPDGARTRIVRIPTAGVMLTSGESVTVYQVTTRGETRVAHGQVIAVERRFATISTDAEVTRGKSYVVKSAGSPGRRGVILDSDW
jgi:hypothetical protein